MVDATHGWWPPSSGWALVMVRRNRLLPPDSFASRLQRPIAAAYS
jgi:hypothetical protein